MIIVDEIVSADGWAARADGDIDFFVGREGLVDSVGNAERMARVAAVLLGTRTYREFSDYWPTQDPALPVNRLPKHVLSTTLDDAPWGALEPATVERGDAVEVARNLERHHGGDLIVWGSLTLARALLAAGAVEEVWLRIVPTALGTGRTFWPERDIEFRGVETVQHPGGWTTARLRL
ncbi:MAG TPA: dihydrofolate reductase family protein [Gaiellales bacterium]|jgi:dihydrofolate reductase